MVSGKSMYSEFDIVRTYAAIVDCIKTNSILNYKSSDNDLGLGVDEKVALDQLAA